MSNEKSFKIKEIFTFFDINYNKKLEFDEFDTAIKSLGLLVSKEELKDYMNKCHVINFDNFNKFVEAKMTGNVNKNELVKAFEFLDPNHTGVALRTDVEKAFLTLGDCLKKEDVDIILKDCSNSKGYVDYKMLVQSLIGK